MIPRATLRLQFHAGFTLDDAVPLVDYFDRLGVSHLYASPLFTAQHGSEHGYNVASYDAVNPELGGEAALRRLVAALRAKGMGLILDIVPNHMGVGGDETRWWLDLLEWGRTSPYSEFFDVDWESTDPLLTGKVLAPFLGDPYGVCLERGDLRLDFAADSGRFAVVYYEHRFPLSPRSYAAVLQQGREPGLQALAEEAAVRRRSPAGQRRAAEALQRKLAEFAGSSGGAAAVMAAVEAFSPATPEGRERLHRLLETQHYRLAWWRTAPDEINWRRFFDVSSLAGLRIERPEVFEATHALVFRLYAEGLIDGVRVDHVDGLAAPRAYCRKLRRRLDGLLAERPADAPPGPAYFVVEKILEQDEPLRADWLVDGTTGYDFMAQAGALLHDPEGAAPLARLWRAVSGRRGDFPAEAEAARRQVLRSSFRAELRACVTAIHLIARRSPETRDWTFPAIERALTELLVHFPVYRTYAGAEGRSAEDQRVFVRALEGARQALRPWEQPLLDHLSAWLGGEPPRRYPTGGGRRARLRAIARFQQLTSPLTAKSLEDTAFYRYGRLLSRNEVGSDPAVFAMDPAAFHAAMAGRLKGFPRAMLASATHDHKRGEDVRARLAVLSELPGDWAEAVRRWRETNGPLRRDLDPGTAPSAGDEYMLYQMLVGAWPLDLAADDRAGLTAFAERLAGWQTKALREAKLETGWTDQNDAYEQGCRDFLEGCLDPTRSAAFLQDLKALVDRVAAAGAVNGLTQTLLKLTVPGVPDTYQGCEFWDFSLVDPDNRRPVDFEARIAALADGGSPAELLAGWRDGRVKQALIARGLDLRRRHPDLFGHGRYTPVQVAGPMADHLLGFRRSLRRATVLVVVPRLVARWCEDLPLPADLWHGTSLALPGGRGEGTWRCLLSDRTARATRGELPLSGALSAFPLALLVREGR